MWASFKVAEKVARPGRQPNTFFAERTDRIGPTNSNSNATYKIGGERAFALSTAGATPVEKDTMTTTVTVPGGGVGAISISEDDCDASCTSARSRPCTSGTGRLQTPYLEWTLVIVGHRCGHTA